MQVSEALLARARKIKLLILDVDGVLTNGSFYFDANGVELKAFDIQDGLGLVLLEKSGITVAVISGRQSKGVEQRMAELSVKFVFQGQSHKLKIYEALLKELNLTPEEVACVGDDLPDLCMMSRTGLSVAVANAVDAVKNIAHWQTSRVGGNGAVREVCDLILASQNLLQDSVKKYAIGNE